MINLHIIAKTNLLGKITDDINSYLLNDKRVNIVSIKKHPYWKDNRLEERYIQFKAEKLDIDEWIVFFSIVSSHHTILSPDEDSLEICNFCSLEDLLIHDMIFAVLQVSIKEIKS
ncbi:MAG: hypothetical protein IJ766_08450 [Clostridia bacterium]|nr:hypothetical protein [Clostridia bacterium]